MTESFPPYQPPGEQPVSGSGRIEMPESGAGPQTQPGVRAPGCGWCGSPDLEDGFLGDNGEGSSGFGKWIRGTLERGLFGGAKGLWSADKFAVTARRCVRCGHLELFAIEQTN